MRPDLPASTLIFGGFALTRLRHSWKLSVSTYLGLTVAIALAVSVALVQTTTAEIGLQRELQDLGDQGWVQVSSYHASDPAALALAENQARAGLQSVMGPLLRPGAAYLASSELIPRSRNGQPIHIDRGSAAPTLAYYEGLDRQISVVAGRIPTRARVGDISQATMSQQGARRLGLELGDRYCLADPTGAGFCVQLAATWQARDPSGTYWGPVHVPYTALMLDGPSYAAIVGGLATPVSTGYVTFTPNALAFKQFAVPDILVRLRKMRGYFSVTHSGGAISTSLDTGLQEYWDRFIGAQYAIQLVAAQILLIALFYLGFAAGHVLDQQREQFAVWRSRGWRRRSIWALLMLEFSILACVALPAGIAVGAVGAAAAIRIVYGSFPAEQAAADLGALWAPAAVALAAGLAVLAFRAAAASRQDLQEVRRLASRPLLQPWWRWRHVDLVLGAVGLVLLVRVSSSEGGPGSDPIALALPALALLLVALAALRLLSPVALVVGMVGKGVAVALASWQLSRRPVQHSSLALLLLFTMALGVFATTYLTTLQANAADRAAYAVGSDLRVHFDSGAVSKPPAKAVDRSLHAANGVTASSLVYRNQGRPGNAPLEPWVLGIDPDTFDRVGWSRPGLNTEPMSVLADRLRPPTELRGYPLPGKPARLGVWIFSPGLTAQVEAVFADSAGKPGDIILGTLGYSGWRYLDAPMMLQDGHPRYPLILKELTIGMPPQAPAAPGQSQPPPAYPYSGTVALSDLSVSPAGSAEPEVLASFSEASGNSGWYATRSEGGLSLGVLKASADFLRDGRPTTLVTPDAFFGDMTIRPVPVRMPLPALASAATLDSLGIPIGGTFPLTIGSTNVLVTVVATVSYFPTLYPEAHQDFLILDRDALLTRLSFGGEAQAWPNEIWATTSAQKDQADQQLLQHVPEVTVIQDRRSLLATTQADPLGLELEANLLVGFAVVLVLAVAAFGLHFLVATAGRQSEYAILDANGLAPWTVQRSLDLEQAVLLVCSVVIGAGLGFVTSWLVIGTLHLETSLSQTVPPTVITVEPRLVFGALLAVIGLAIGAGQLASRLGRRQQLMEQLRMLG
jgi:hypothetical protein